MLQFVRTRPVLFSLIGLAVLIRVVLFMRVPASLYWEEVALGYDAYSIATTLRDHHGNFLPLVAFESFGDWKPSGYFYAAAIPMRIFGLAPWVVRLPSLLAGVAVVVGIAALGKQLCKAPRIALFLVALAPWAIHFSLAAWEAHLALAYLIWMQVLLVPLIQQKHVSLYRLGGAVLLACLAAYTYHAQRFIAPALFAVPVFLYVFESFRMKQLRADLRYILGLTSTVLAVAVLALAPLFVGTASHRLEETSIFTDSSIIEKSNALRAQHNFSLLSRVMYHRYLFFAGEAVTQAVTHFSPEFLFMRGDGNLRHSFGSWGMFYIVDAVLILAGLYYAVRTKKKVLFYLLAWIAIAIVPAAITRPVPHGLRVLPLYPPLTLLATFGVVQLAAYLPRKQFRVLASIGIVLYLGFFAAFIQYYTTEYRVASASEWQYGYREMVAEVSAYLTEHPDLPVAITREYGRPAMYYFFFTAADPRTVQNASRTAPMDQREFLAYESVSFVRSIDEVSVTPQLVASEPAFREQLASRYATETISEVKGLDGEVVWVIYRVE